MARQQTQTVVETDVCGNNEDWGDDDAYSIQPTTNENGRNLGK